MKAKVEGYHFWYLEQTAAYNSANKFPSLISSFLTRSFIYSNMWSFESERAFSAHFQKDNKRQGRSFGISAHVVHLFPWNDVKRRNKRMKRKIPRNYIRWVPLSKTNVTIFGKITWEIQRKNHPLTDRYDDTTQSLLTFFFRKVFCPFSTLTKFV